MRNEVSRRSSCFRRNAGAPFWNERTAGSLLAGGVGWALWHAGLFQRDRSMKAGGRCCCALGRRRFSRISPALLQVTWEAMLSTLAYALYGTALSLGIGLARRLVAPAFLAAHTSARSFCDGGR